MSSLLELECLLNVNIMPIYCQRKKHSEQTVQLVNEVNIYLYYPLLLFT